MKTKSKKLTKIGVGYREDYRLFNIWDEYECIVVTIKEAKLIHKQLTKILRKLK